jgi:acylphosphatase
MKVRAHVFISGRVQGVFFRSETRRKAKIGEVKGWIRNLLDGRVEAIFEGEENAVNELIEFCRQGPPAARVTRLDVNLEKYTGEFKDFRIRYRF